MGGFRARGGRYGVEVRNVSKADTLTYRRAMLISLFGFALQLLLAIGVGVYARMAGGDHTATTFAIAIGLGCIVWLTLAFLYDQHRRERIEAIESESLASATSSAASAFDGTGDELLVASRRLAMVQKWIVPIASLIFASLMLGLGIVRLLSARELFSHDDFVEPDQRGWGIGLAMAAAFGGFVFARFVSGMAKQTHWAALRAGAAQAVFASIVGLLMAIALFVRLAGGPDWPLRVLLVGVPVAMIALGAEVYLNFVLDLYRPRRAGEVRRPAFDSRLLGLAAAPDKIAESVREALSYQFGVDVTGTWFYQLLSRSIMVLVVLALLIAWAMTSLVVIQPHQRGLVLTFGKISEPVASLGERDGQEIGPGLHVKWPWPFSSVEIPSYSMEDGDDESTVRTTTGVQVINLAANPPDRGEDGPILWSEQHTTVEIYNIAQPERAIADPDSAGSELSLVAIEVPVHYVIEDVMLYDSIAAPGQRRFLLQAIGRSEVSRYISTMTVDRVVATSRTSLADELHAVLEESYGRLNGGQGAGIRILFVGVSGAHPPRDVAPNFERVVQARQNRESKIEAANKSKTTTLTRVAGRADLAEQIVEILNRIDAMRRSGADADAVLELEVEAQQLLAETGGEAGQLLQYASAERWTRHMTARADSLRFAGQSTMHAANPRLFEAQLYFDALKDVMSESRVYLLQDGLPRDMVFELQDQSTGRNVFDANSAPQP
ncbi:MAG: hypothetical protein DHS20C14_00680 [Phycisphaeraceae bacterium]|nr:MAG: hypothetical protein DHS20C14_00680 [Phycisphaeraceae bacterium]